MKRCFAAIFAAALIAAFEGAAQETEPPLPPGLEPPAETESPPLPPGLEAPSRDSAQPPLPPGLGDEPEPTPDARDTSDHSPLELHGFVELRGSLRLMNDPVQPRDALLGETRLQLETAKRWSRAAIEFTGDLILDGVLENVDYDIRRLRFNTTLGNNVDISLGRQVLTWGTGDLIFINDLFPKDWQSFLSGRDEEYLKAPSDVVKVSAYTDWFNIDFVYTPQFASDRFITGERISYWNPLLGRRSGRDMQVNFDSPNDWFEDDEFAVRVHRLFGSTEVALYGYSGYWKSPAGQQLVPPRATFPPLSVVGASVRGALGKGIANAEIGYYDSRDDRDGGDPFVDNSEFRLLVGYEQEIGKEFTGGLQYYWVHMMDYDAYRNTLPFFIEARDEDRHVFSIRLTKLLMNQDLTLSSFLFYSPTDGDAYWRPRAVYNVNDDWRVELGGNIFFGEADHTFYAQFQDNSNIYAAVRYSF